MLIDLNVLLEYTDWERQKWRESLGQHGDRILLTTTGANSDARFETVGDLIRHIFSAEKRYVERLSEKPLTDTASLPTENIEVLFKFGEESRKALRAFIEALPSQQLDVPRDFMMANHPIRATPKKLIVNVLLHEIRHWAQIATLLRQNSFQPGPGRRCPCSLGASRTVGAPNAWVGISTRRLYGTTWRSRRCCPCSSGRGCDLCRRDLRLSHPQDSGNGSV